MTDSIPAPDAEGTQPRRKALAKRLRFEVFRRDNHACRYCGQMAPEVKLTVDHVVPVVLGGTDDPANLVTACSDCNAGKSSIPADADVVADVAQDALRWRQAMEVANALAAKEREVADAYCREFEEQWMRWTYPSRNEFGKSIRKHFDLPGGWERRVRELMQAGLPIADVKEGVDIALGAKYVKDEFAYFLGVTRQMLAQRQSLAAEMLRRGMAE